jgi:hypothetical protein
MPMRLAFKASLCGSPRLRRGLSMVLALLLLALLGGGQDIGQLRKKLTEVAGDVTLRQLLVGRPLTTNLDDVVSDVPFLDPYNPPDCREITVLPKAPKGGWLLRPGSYMYLAQSYCMGPGARRPWQGDGYAYAPIKGPQADTIRSILRNSARFPDIPQEQIQILLWRIIARARWTDLSSEQKAYAARLLSPKQIAQLNGSALDLLPGDVLDRSLAEAVPAVARTLMAEAKMRELFASGEATYEELEEIAVPPEGPEAAPGRITPVRWSFHPAGYFIRYRPLSYAETIIQIRVPEAVKIETDSSGRILSISDPVRRLLLRIVYNDSVLGDPYPGAPGVLAYLFKSVHFERPDPKNPDMLLQHDFTDPGGTLMGVPPAGKSGASPLRWRYELARELTISTQRTLSSLPVPRNSARDAESLANIVHLALGLYRLLARTADPPPWTFMLIDLVMEAWQYTLCRAAGVAAIAAPTGPAINSRVGLAQSTSASLMGLAGLFRLPAEGKESLGAGGWLDAPGGDGTLLMAGPPGQTFRNSEGEEIELVPELAVPGVECQMIADSVACKPTADFQDPRSWMQKIDDWLPKEKSPFKDRGGWFADMSAANVPSVTSENNTKVKWEDESFWDRLRLTVHRDF